MTYFANRANPLQIVSCRAFSAGPRCRRASSPLSAPPKFRRMAWNYRFTLNIENGWKNTTNATNCFSGRLWNRPLTASGASRGVVLGGNDCGPHYVSQFWMFSNPRYPAYREVEPTARNMYNIGLVAGYGEGKSLTRNQKGNLFRYIHGNMTNATRGMYSGNFKDWTLKKKQDYYIDCGAIFRANVLAD